MCLYTYAGCWTLPTLQRLEPSDTLCVVAIPATFRKIEMNKDQVKGRVEDVKGKIKEATGKAVGNDRLTTEGKIDQVAGKTQANVGDAKETVKKAIDKI